MEIVRKIGNVDILVDCNLPHEIYFDENLAKENDISAGLSQLDICQLLSKDSFRPLYLKWELVDKCNFSCPFCYIVGHSNNKVVRFADVKKEIDILIENGLLYCLLTGGEATIHPDFIDIYRHLKESGVIVEVYSNGAKINKEHFALFQKYNPYKLEITIYGLTDLVFKRNTKSKFAALDILDNINALHDIGINVICKTPVNSMTIEELEEIRHWCKDRNIKHYHSSNISDSYNNLSLVNFTAPSEIKIKYDVENEIKFIREYGSPVTGNQKSCFSCAVGSYGIHINSKGELLACSSFNGKKDGYNIKSLGMIESLARLREYVSSVYKNTIIGCVGCDSSAHCKMCPALAEEVKYNGKVIGYRTNDEYCNNIRKYYKKVCELVLKKANKGLETDAQKTRAAQPCR